MLRSPHQRSNRGGGLTIIDNRRPDDPTRSGGGLRVIILVAVCLVLFFSFLGARPLWDQDEGMHAATSKDMVVSGDWITPTLNGRPFFDKPAFHNWLVAISFLVFGITEFAARLPNAVGGFGCVLVSLILGRRIYGAHAGFLGATALATTAGWIALSRTVMHDMSLTFFVTLGLTLFYIGYSRDGTERRWFLFSYTAIGLAALVKGPIGVLLPGAVVFLFLAARRQLGFLAKMSLGWGVLIGLAVAAPWYTAVSLRNPEYFHYFFVELNFGSFLSGESHHPEPVYYYLPVLIVLLLPWSFFLPAALVRVWRRRAEDTDGGTDFLLIWAGVHLLFFSLATSKLPTYILPALPPLAVILGRLWHDAIHTAQDRVNRAVFWSYAPFLLFPAAVAHRISTHELPLSEIAAEYGIGPMTAASPVIALMTGLLVSFLLFWQRRPGAAFWGVAAAFPLFFALFGAAVLPAMNTYQSSKGTSRVLDEVLPPGEPISSYQRLRQSTLFYTNRLARVIETAGDLAEYLASDEQVYCIAKRKRLAESGVEAHIVMEYGDDVIVSNRPGDISR